MRVRSTFILRPTGARAKQAEAIAPSHRSTFFRLLHPYQIAVTLIVLLTACAPAPTTYSPFPPPGTAAHTATVPLPTATASRLPSATHTVTSEVVASLAHTPTPTNIPSLTPTDTPTPDLRLPPERWREWPVIPALSARARQVLRDGLSKGANPRAFAKVGDCETITDWFLVDFDKGKRFYDLGPYASLQPVIDYFSGSFGRKSAASMRGFTAASALSPIWADPNVCRPGETPLGCEYRLQKPVMAFIMLGTNDVVHKATFEANLRKLLEYTLAQGVLPVMATKADNLEGDHALNLSMAKLAYEYDLPLWNFWLAVQTLPSHGLVEDGAHLTYLPNRLSTPDALQTAWPVRNLNALQVLEAVMGAVQEQR